MINLEEFIIGEDTAEKISDHDILMEYFEDGKPLQHLFGFTDETVVQFYEAAKDILEQKRYDDAIDAFTFLTTLNPYISDFWLGLGMAQQKNNDFDAALYSYSVGFTVEGRKIFPYVLAAQCCMEVGRFDKALEIIGMAERYAEKCSSTEETTQLKKDAKAARHYIEQERNKR